MYYKSTSITKRTKTATVLLVVAALASVLVGGSIVESAHLAFAHKDDRERTIEQPTNIHQKTECLTAGGNSGIQGSCLNAGGTTTSNTGGINTNMGSSSTNMGSIKLPFGGFP